MVNNSRNSGWSTANAESFSAGFFSFSGRLNRLAFFLRLLGVTILTPLIILFIWVVVGFVPALGALLWPVALGLSILIAILALIANIALHVRRLHDMGFSGLWYVLILVISVAGRPDEFVEQAQFLNYPVDSTLAVIARIISLVILLVLLFYPGTGGANKYGPDPLRGGAMETENTGVRRHVVRSTRREMPDAEEDNFWRK